MGLLTVLVAAGLFGLGEAQVARAERLAAADLATRLEGGWVKVDVQPNGFGAAWGELDRATISAGGFAVDGLPLYEEPERSTAGRVQRLQLRLSDFSLKGLRIESLDADILRSRYDLGLARREGRIRLSRSGSGRGRVLVRQEALAAWIPTRFAEIKRATVTLDKGFAWIEGYGEFLFVATEFQVVSRLAVVEGTKLVLDRPKIYFRWQRADPLAAQQLLHLLNPVVDLDGDLGLGSAIQVERLVLEDGVLLAEGQTRIPPRPAQP